MDSSHKNWKELHQKQKELRKKWKKDKTIKLLDKEREENQNKVESTDSNEESIEIPSTVSIAVPGSILDNAQSPELRSYLAGQIARAACVYKIDEVVIFDDYGSSGSKKSKVTQYGELKLNFIQRIKIMKYLYLQNWMMKLKQLLTVVSN